ncbi:transposase, partial [Paraburkholderia sediminicola]
WTQRMTGNPSWQVIPTELSLEQFEQFVLPHLRRGRRGPPPTLPLHKIFNYILRVLYMGCQWKMLPIERNAKGRREIHYTRIYRLMRRWQADGCMDAIFAGSVTRLHDDQLLDLTVIHGDGTTTAAKKGGDNLGYSGHKHLKGDKVVAFCDRDCNIIAPFICAPGNRDESPLLLRDALRPDSPSGPRHRHGLTGLERQSGRRLRLPGQPQGHFQPGHGVQHSGKSARA